MQFRMKALLVTLLFGLAGAAMFALSASADVVYHNRMEQELRTRAARLRPRTSAAGDPDTVYVGHVNTVVGGVPGTAGGFGPFHIGRGSGNLVGGALGTPTQFNGTFDFDHFNMGDADSLQGWWGIQAPFGSIGPTNFDDNLRPWFALDYGNNGNYVIPAGNSANMTDGLGHLHKRTFGVVGYWHRDRGNLDAPLANPDAVPGPNPEWAPIGGSASAWCGLRADGDNTVIDQVTGNPINGNLVSFNGNNSGAQFTQTRPQGTDNNFPGYGAQWDQMLYRDVNFAANASGNVTITFKYTTNMSLGEQGGHSSQAGWFDKDPVKTAVVGDGNYRSIFANQSAGGDLVDSFMVYIGAPVNEGACTFSDGSVAPVYDLQRRWFSEVVKINTPGTTYSEILSKAGSNGTTLAPITFSLVLTANQVNTILDNDGGASNGGRLRLVFRVKTNRGSDDENSGNTPAEGTNTTGQGTFSSLTRGAAIVDDVSVTGGGASAMANGDFEATGSVDNATNVTAVAAWKSTGKPPGTWFHIHRIDEPGSPLAFNDPCGTITASVRNCNMTGAVLSPGDHDSGDKPGGLYGGNYQDQQKYAVSPTFNLMSSGAGDYNGQGIDAEIAGRDWLLIGDYMHNLYNYDLTGDGFRLGFQAYPATQANGQKTWGCMNKSGFFGAWDNLGCYNELLTDPKTEQLLVTSNANGKPDSIRFYVESMSRCMAKVGTVSSLACSPKDGALAGGYFDNLTVAFARHVAAAPPPTLSAVFASQFQDCFPVNAQNKTVTTFGLAYDTLTARVQTSYNIAPQTGSTTITGNNARENIAGDSALATGVGLNVRMDLVFRILPGPGNYMQIGNRLSGVARRPDGVKVLASGGDAVVGGPIPNVSKFWGTYLNNNGAFGTGGNGTTGPGHGPGGVAATGVDWDPNKWNSARMDTLETNFFPTSVLSNSETANLTPGTWMTMYHEQDPKFAILGIDKNRCFLQSIKKSSGVANINCGNLNGNPGYPPAGIYQNAGVPIAGTGLSASENGLAIGHTYEYTKILPDGQFTPGTEVQYFYRKADVGNNVAFEMTPDTNYIFPQATEIFGYFDFHRWRELRVLPDRWKDPAFNAGGTGMACMLVLDLGERRGDLGYWVATADSMGLTTTAKRGAHNGWRARPDQDWAGVAVGGDDSICRRDNGGQPGSLFDVYSTGDGESNIPSGRPGSRGANRNTTGGSLTTGKWSTHGPNEDMVKNYRVLVLLASDIGTEALGPIPDQTDADIPLFQSFLSLPGGSAQPRGLWMQGQRLGELFSLHHNTFMNTFLRASLNTGDYRTLTGDVNNVTNLVVVPPITPGPGNYTFGVSNLCSLNNDAFTVVTAAPAGQVGAYYNTVGVNNVGSVYGPASGGSRPFKTLYNGWTFGLFGGMGTQTTLLNVGTRKYVYDLLTNASAFGDLLCNPTGNPVAVGDGNGPNSFVNFMNLKSSNPMRSGEARIAFGLAKTDRVQINVFDVTGRLLKTVADRTFVGGQQHIVTWDGTNQSGDKVKPGVYFYQLKASTWTSQKKLAVLAN